MKVINLLKKDFQYFVCDREQNHSPDFAFTFNLDKPDFSPLDNKIATRQSFNSVTYDLDHIRYNDYYGVALSKYDYKLDVGFVTSADLGALHEIAYLLILSRTGKRLDDKSMHKVHAMGVKYNSTALILMMPMKGGKSTLFVDLLKKENIQIISDDTPLIDLNGNSYSFPLRVGVHDTSRLPEGDEKLIYSLDRLQYGKKRLVPLAYFKNKVAGKSNKIVLLDGRRIYSDTCKITPQNGFYAFKALITHMVVGVGLPLIIEYFLEYNLKDTFRNFKILSLRMIAAFNLSRKSKFYKIYLGTNKDKNASVLYEHLKKIDNEI